DGKSGDDHRSCYQTYEPFVADTLTAGVHPSSPLKTLFTVNFFASFLVNWRDQVTRDFTSAPAPLLLNSAYLEVFSRAGRSQLCHPTGRTTSLISLFRYTTAE